MKKVLIVFLIFAHMNCYLGCAKKFIITDKELDTETNDNNLFVSIKNPVFHMRIPEHDTKDSTDSLLNPYVPWDSLHYIFEANMYRFKNDSLDGIAILYNTEQKEMIKIALNDIARAGVATDKKIKWGQIGTTVLGVIVAIMMVGFIYLGIKECLEKQSEKNEG